MNECIKGVYNKSLEYCWLYLVGGVEHCIKESIAIYGLIYDDIKMKRLLIWHMLFVILLDEDPKCRFLMRSESCCHPSTKKSDLQVASCSLML